MNLSDWEQKAISELKTHYIAFFEKLKMYGRQCYLMDANEYLNRNIDLRLTPEQEDVLRNYWCSYIKDYDCSYHQFYLNSCGYFDVKFIPDDVYTAYIDAYFNNRMIEAGFSDKNYFDLILSGFKMPKTYVHLINGIAFDSSYKKISVDSAKEILTSVNSFIVKPSVASFGGENISYFVRPTGKEILGVLNGPERNLIFQEYIVQSKVTEGLHRSSLNTIRVMTLLEDDCVDLLSPIIKMGVGNSIVDNASSGGIFCKILENGNLDNTAYNMLGERFYEHPDGYKFSGINLPFMNAVKSVVTSAAFRFPHFRLIGWDIAIDQNNTPVIIEANLTMSSIEMVQLCCGPLFGDKTDDILDEVFHNKKKHHYIMDIAQYI